MYKKFFNEDDAVKDLIRRYQEHGTLIVAVDFDNTLFNFSRNINLDLTPIHELIKNCKEEGFLIVIYTARNENKWKEVVNYCESIDLKYDAINKDVVPLSSPTSGKIYYNILLDDKAGLGQAFSILQKTLHKIQNDKLYERRKNV